MATVVVMPKLGLTMTEGTIEKWLKGEGDEVEKGEPLVCILTEKPVAVEGQVAIRPMMWMTLSVDHRILDGREGAEFLGEIKRLVENPQLLLM